MAKGFRSTSSSFDEGCHGALKLRRLEFVNSAVEFIGVNVGVYAVRPCFASI